MEKATPPLQLSLLNQQQNQNAQELLVELNGMKIDMNTLKEAIVDLYLAIKIRSAEELEKVDEKLLHKEREKLLTKDCFVVLEYIRSSIEIIMSLKIEDLEHNENGGPKRISASQSHSSMRLGQGAQQLNNSTLPKATIESQKGQIAPPYESATGGENLQLKSPASSTQDIPEPPKEYERLIQKLEADIRGHIRLEHEMKIHMDYLEGKCEESEKLRAKWEQERRQAGNRMKMIEERLRAQMEGEVKKVREECGKQIEMIDQRWKEAVEAEKRARVGEMVGRKQRGTGVTMSMDFATIQGGQPELVLPPQQLNQQPSTRYIYNNSNNANITDRNIYQTLDVANVHHTRNFSNQSANNRPSLPKSNIVQHQALSGVFVNSKSDRNYQVANTQLQQQRKQIQSREVSQRVIQSNNNIIMPLQQQSIHMKNLLEHLQAAPISRSGSLNVQEFPSQPTTLAQVSRQQTLIHPYVSDVINASSQKKGQKKKASSIDFGNQLMRSKRKQQSLRNSHVFVSYHNQEQSGRSVAQTQLPSRQTSTEQQKGVWYNQEQTPMELSNLQFNHIINQSSERQSIEGIRLKQQSHPMNTLAQITQNVEQQQIRHIRNSSTIVNGTLQAPQSFKQKTLFNISGPAKERMHQRVTIKRNNLNGTQQ
ncbi:hypothetical protein FGO68_gene5190 [Halteria grandinella]|uniref:Uncharacterized protein n=1 Tax=Halteria grandinella TaxID=5974 RepID=A0A8J8NT76_HALGN|nr:hypothetical protein FGO68_gene5190 [Halteria grandinella]